MWRFEAIERERVGGPMACGVAVRLARGLGIGRKAVGDRHDRLPPARPTGLSVRDHAAWCLVGVRAARRSRAVLILLV